MIPWKHVVKHDIMFPNNKERSMYTHKNCVELNICV